MTPWEARAAASELFDELDSTPIRLSSGVINPEYYERTSVLADVLSYLPPIQTGRSRRKTQMFQLGEALALVLQGKTSRLTAPLPSFGLIPTTYRIGARIPANERISALERAVEAARVYIFPGQGRLKRVSELTLDDRPHVEYTYGPYRIWVSGPYTSASSTSWYATARGPGRETELFGTSPEDTLNRAVDWIRSGWRT